MNDDEVMSKQQLADFLKVELKTINYLLYSKQIPCFKVGRGYRFLKSEIMKWIKSRLDNAWQRFAGS